MPQWKLFLQAYVQADAYERAFAIACDLIRTIGPLATVADCHVSPYYKFEDQYGVWLLLEADDKPAVWQALQSALASGFRVGGDETDRHAIWNSRLDGPCPVPAARWLNLELFTTGDPPPEEAD